MSTFYFTYEGDLYGRRCGDGPREQFFKGGWTEIEAENERAARMFYYGVHPKCFDKDVSGHDGVYTTDEMRRFGFLRDGINGYFCVERITMNVEVLERGAMNVE